MHDSTGPFQKECRYIFQSILHLLLQLLCCWKLNIF